MHLKTHESYLLTGKNAGREYLKQSSEPSLRTGNETGNNSPYSKYALGTWGAFHKSWAHLKIIKMSDVMCYIMSTRPTVLM